VNEPEHSGIVFCGKKLLSKDDFSQKMYRKDVEVTNILPFCSSFVAFMLWLVPVVHLAKIHSGQFKSLLKTFFDLADAEY